MNVYKDHFIDLGRWQTTPEVIASESFMSCQLQPAQKGGAIAWLQMEQAVSSGTAFRLDLRVKGVGVWGGLTNAGSLADLGSGAHESLTIGLDVHQKQISVLVNQVETATIPVEAGEDDSWHLQLASDGKVLTATCFDCDGNIKGSLRVQPPQCVWRAFCLRFTSNLGQIDTFAAITGALDGYGDAAYNQRLALWLNPDPNSDWAGAEERAFAVLPASYTSQLPVRLCLDNHGRNGAPEGYVRDELWKVFNERGYLIAGSYAYGNAYGHSQASETVIRLRNYLHQLFHLHYKAFSMGESMGGLLAYLCPLDYPDKFAAIASIYGAANLTWRYYGIDSPGLARSEDINAAYDCSEQSFFYKTCSRNVFNRIPELVGFPIKCWHGDADKIVGINHSRYIVDEVNTLGGQADLVVVPGAGHGRNPQLRSSSVVEFFDSVPDSALCEPALK